MFQLNLTFVMRNHIGPACISINADKLSQDIIVLMALIAIHLLTVVFDYAIGRVYKISISESRHNKKPP
jgi:hypothetical protein